MKSEERAWKLWPSPNSGNGSEVVWLLLGKLAQQREALYEARTQLGFLNSERVMASTNVVLKRIDEALKT